MKRIVGLLSALSLLAHAYTYNQQLLQVYAKIAPRMMLLVESTEQHLHPRYLLCILYEPGNENEAESLKEMMFEAYPDGLKGKDFQVVTVPFATCQSCRNADLVVMLDADEATIRNAVANARTMGIATMSYSSRFLDEGVMMSLDLGATVRPYINLRAAKAAGIPINDVLLRISRIHNEGETP